jgi:hypothetical protein
VSYRRGPDLQPRNLVKALILKAMADEGRVVTEVTVNGKKLDWRKQPKVRHALVHNAARGLQRVFEDMAEGDQDAYGHGIRALSMMHEVLAPAKDELKGYGTGGPIAPRLLRPTATGPARSEPAGGGSDAAVVVDGQAYVDGVLPSSSVTDTASGSSVGAILSPQRLSPSSDVQNTRYGRRRGSSSTQRAAKVGSRGTHSALARGPEKRPAVTQRRNRSAMSGPYDMRPPASGKTRNKEIAGIRLLMAKSATWGASRKMSGDEN